MTADGRRGPGSALHAARPTVAAAWCAVVAAVALAVSHPLALTGLLVGVGGVAVRVGAARHVRRLLLLAVPLLLVLVVVQVLLDRHGLTVLARLGTAPVLGAVDVTLEALVAAGVLVLRLLVVFVVTAIAAACVDVDALLLAAHRRWPAGALTASLALRIAPVLVRDGARMADARRSRPPGTPGAGDDPATRLLVVRAVTGSVLERASDLSATLELRGHGLPRTPARRRPAGTRRPRSRHDLALSASATLLVAGAAAGIADGALRLGTDPELAGAPLPAVLLATAVLGLLVVAPILARRGTTS
ncbi:CbiQ family ECF transporter T component [Patulibacter sp.]|uniref:CbiQ family ECF transporter T component n=1 Tax=Patulibacter sp. TaxID=1912859 RepID=UPI00271CAC58|nr:CbiQ family ECF transporter T component [Patulibacter sp.]MDO9409034.1 CbiQ family ECF transporter T component [Patulibacter sp.]